MRTSCARMVCLPDKGSAIRLMVQIGVDLPGAKLMAEKALTYAISLKDIKSQAANILKQEMLGLGGDAAVHRDVSSFKASTTSVLLLGVPKHYNYLISKLKSQPFGLKQVGREIQGLLNRYQKKDFILCCGTTSFNLRQRTIVMGILNVTPDSFSDGKKYLSVNAAVKRAQSMVEEGADIIDVGGESTRPSSLTVDEQEELKRIVPVVEQLAKKIRIPLSIDTTKAGVARACLKAGATMINDTSGLRDDPNMKKVVASFGVPVVLMHRLGLPRTMQENPKYTSLMGEITDFLFRRVEEATQAGIKESCLLVDPGIGFGKTLEHNLIILKHLSELKVLGLPILVGTSRKSFIGATLNLPVEERLAGTAATVSAAIFAGAHLVRVHDVKEMVRVVKMTDAIKRAEEENI